MAEVVGLVASVVQLAGAGLKLSQTLYQYADGVASADRRIKDIANEVKLTSFVIQELGTIFEKDETANLISENAVRMANETIKECFAVFTELELKINKGKPGKMGRLMLPFKDNKIELLRSQIDKLKSTLELLMQVLIHAHQVSSEKYNREAEAKHREEIKQLLENKKQATKKYEESLRNFSISDGSTVVDDGDRSLQDKDDIGPSSDLFNTAGAIGSTINPDTLATCVDHVRSLLADIETLQLALAKQVNGDDHSDHHQKAIGSYFLARSHLDSVLLGNSQANVTDAKIRQSISKTSTNTSTTVSDAIYVEPPKRPHPTRRRRSVLSYDERVREELMMAQERQRARIVAEAKAKSNSMPESSYRTARKIVNDSKRHPAYRPSVRAESIKDVPLDLPPGAECRRTNYSEEYALSRRTHTVEQPRKSRLTAPDKSELDGGYRTSMVSGKKKGKKRDPEVIPDSVPRLQITSSEAKTAFQKSSDDEIEVEVPERITARRRRLQFSDLTSRKAEVQHQSMSPVKLAKVQARTRGERLWQEELRRREGSSTSARDDVYSERFSRPHSASYRPSQVSRITPSQSSASNLSHKSSSYRPTVSIQEDKRRPKENVVKIDQSQSRVPERKRLNSSKTSSHRQSLSSQHVVTIQNREEARAEEKERRRGEKQQRREHERQNESNTDSTSTLSSGEVNENVSINSCLPLWPQLTT